MLSKSIFNIFLFCLGMWSASGALSEIYRWTDEQGNVHYSDRKTSRHVSKKVEVRVNAYESVSYDSSIFDTGKKVVMYSTEWCGYCKKAKRYFNMKGITYTEYDVEKNARAKSEYQAMGATGVPVILVGKKRMNGFSEKGFEKLYR